MHPFQLTWSSWSLGKACEPTGVPALIIRITQPDLRSLIEVTLGPDVEEWDVPSSYYEGTSII